MYPFKNLTDFGMTQKPAGSTSTLVFKNTMDNVAYWWAGALAQVCGVKSVLDFWGRELRALS